MSSMPSRRYDRIDALRGVAIVWMTAFHFCFDLSYFGWVGSPGTELEFAL